MYRCLTAFLAALTFALPVAAQTIRNFPQNALRGTVQFGQPPLITLNGKPNQLAPGSRIRGENNLLVMSGELVNTKAVVNYTFDATGLVRDVWILRPEEVKVRPWPTSQEQAQAWSFDPAAQTWSRP